MDLRNEINKVLIEWDPIGIANHTDIESEYSRYIDEIIEVINNKDQLASLIYDIEGNRIGFFYTSDEDKHNVIDKILKIGKMVE